MDIFESFINGLNSNQEDVLPKDSLAHSLNLRATAEESYTKDIYGIKEIEAFNLEELINTLAYRLKKMQTGFEACCKGTALEEELEVSRLIGDMWLYSFGDLLDYSLLEPQQKERLLQYLLERFKIEGSGKEHFQAMADNDEYKKYMTGLFAVGNGCGGFWHMLATLGSQDDGHNSLAMDFLTEYIRFMVQLEVYLDTVLPGFGFVNNMRYYVMSIVSTIADNMQASMASAPLLQPQEHEHHHHAHDHDHDHHCEHNHCCSEADEGK